MDGEKPKTIDEYKKWLRREHGIRISRRTQKHYDSVTGRMKTDFEKSGFWIQLAENLRELNDEYLLKTKYPLLMTPEPPKLYVKSFGSFLEKTFRKNILENEHWPSEPEGGWILPSNWYSRINDIVRTLFVVKYLDGVEFMKDKIQSLCLQQRLSYQVFLEAREEGYYAAHLYTKQEFEIPRVTWDTERVKVSIVPRVTWDTERVKVSIEIQITTQLQEVIRKLLHRYYEERRKGAKEQDTKWQWNYKGDEFVANYLGHILHYIEGMIMEIREKQKEEIT